MVMENGPMVAWVVGLGELTRMGQREHSGAERNALYDRGGDLWVY